MCFDSGPCDATCRCPFNFQCPAVREVEETTQCVTRTNRRITADYCRWGLQTAILSCILYCLLLAFSRSLPLLCFFCCCLCVRFVVSSFYFSSLLSIFLFFLAPCHSRNTIHFHLSRNIGDRSSPVFPCIVHAYSPWSSCFH